MGTNNVHSVIMSIEKTIKSWHNSQHDWPYGKNIIIKIFPEDDCPFIGPCIRYKCDLKRKNIRNIVLEDFESIDDFIFEMKAIHRGEERNSSPILKKIAENIILGIEE